MLEAREPGREDGPVGQARRPLRADLVLFKLVLQPLAGQVERQHLCQGAEEERTSAARIQTMRPEETTTAPHARATGWIERLRMRRRER